MKNKWSSNENKLMKNEGCGIFMNKTKFENDMMKETQEKSSLQSKRNAIPQNDEEKTKQFGTTTFSKQKMKAK
jgi:hypothetical protein